MALLESVWIWQDERVRERLSWYYQVSLNQKPAKYLICRRVSVDFSKDQSEEELWDIHEEAVKEFLDLYKGIRGGELTLKEIEKPKKNLLDLKAELVMRMLTHCNFCRWNCRVDRSKGTRHGTCQLESNSRVSSYFHHRGEELPIRGRAGSGTIFFTSCNMRCSFCQNGDISKDKDNGIVFTPYMLALAMWQLRLEGCHNINLVGGEPTIHLHTIVEAIRLLRFFDDRRLLAKVMQAKADAFVPYRMSETNASYMGEFNAPILWNSNMYMSLETMKILRELVDIWLPDFKFGSDKCSVRLARTPWYWETVSMNHKLIYDWGEDIIIRHLVMPNHVECCTKPILKWISENMQGVLVNVMDQYHPDCYADPSSPMYDSKFSDISRRPTRGEIAEAYRYARELGLNFELISWEKNTMGITL